MEYTAKTLNSARGDYGENKAKQYLLSQGYRIRQLKYKLTSKKSPQKRVKAL